MKKILIFVMCFINVFSLGAFLTFSENHPVKVILDKKEIQFDVNPIIVSGRTLIPMRSIFEEIGAQVLWDSSSKTIFCSRNEDRIILKIDNKVAFVNEEKVLLDVPPTILNGRTLVPVRFISESIGAEVSWNDKTKTVSIKTDMTKTRNTPRQTISSEANPTPKPTFTSMQKPTASPTPTSTPTSTPKPTSTLTSTPKPISTSTSTSTPKPTATPTPTPKPTSTSTPTQWSFNGSVDSLIGVLETDILRVFGEPGRKDLSKYGFQWYIYNKDYKKYIQIGIFNGKVVGVYTNSDQYKFIDSICVGTQWEDVSKKLGTPLTYIQKGRVRYMMESSEEQEVYLSSKGFYSTVFYDVINSRKVTSIMLIEGQVELGLKGYYGTPGESLRVSFERQMFDIINSTRARNGKPLLIWDDKLGAVARAHSEDMVTNDYFSHTNLKGESPFVRMSNAGITYKSASENIAWGASSAIYAHEGLMNSEGHRKNILGSFTNAGIGVSIGESSIAYTQNFRTLK